MSDTPAPNAESTSTTPHTPLPTKEDVKPSPWRERLVQSPLKRLWRHLYYRVPGLVPSPYQTDREFFLQKDESDNLASRVPEDELLQLVAVWGVEIFGPAEIDALYLALDRLEWNDERNTIFNGNPAAWIREQRTYGTEGSFNLGLLERQGKKAQFFPSGRPTRLPDTVQYGHGYVYQISPSLTAVLLCFVLDESSRGAYRSELNRDRSSEHEGTRTGYRSHGVEHVKRRAVDLVRDRSRALVVDWFAEHLPGMFSRGTNRNCLPTAELVVTTHRAILDRPKTELDWARLIAPVGHRDVWTLKNFDGLAISWPESEGDTRYHAIINLRAGQLTDDRYLGEGGDRAKVSYASASVRGVLVNFAAIAALREISRHLRLAPSSLSIETASRRGTVKSLEQIRLLFDQTVGIPTISTELVSRSATIYSYKWECAAFQTEALNDGDPPIEISEWLRSRTHLLASRIVTVEKETREHLEQLASILSTRESIRTQARMEWVTLGAAVVSAFSLIATLMSVDRFANYINKRIEILYESKKER